MNLNYFFSLYLYIIGCFMYCFFYKHLLLTLISLEYMVIMLIFNMFMMLMIYQSSFFLLIFLMVIFVCEGALALSLIVLLVRFYGNDYINSLVILKW